MKKYELTNQTLREFANRIEAAEKREREKGAEAAQIFGEVGEFKGNNNSLLESCRVA